MENQPTFIQDDWRHHRYTLRLAGDSQTSSQTPLGQAPEACSPDAQFGIRPPGAAEAQARGCGCDGSCPSREPSCCGERSLPFHHWGGCKKSRTEDRCDLSQCFTVFAAAFFVVSPVSHQGVQPRYKLQQRCSSTHIIIIHLGGFSISKTA